MLKPQEIANYLKDNPGFFVDHREALEHLNLPELTPFHERQVLTLRNRQQTQQAQFASLVDVVRSNQDLVVELHRIAIELLVLEDRTPIDLIALSELIKQRFSLSDVAVLLKSQKSNFPQDVDYQLLCQRVEHLHSVCDDRVAKQLSSALFPGTQLIKSCAFIPIVHQSQLYGVLIIGSVDSDRFQPDMGGLFLDFLGQLIGAYLVGRT